MLRPALSIASHLYALGAAVDRRRKSADAVQLPKRVISVGNLAVGGTGKTPVLIRAARDLERAGMKPAILTRGYRGFLSGPSAPAVVIGRSVDPASSAAGLSDEAQLMASTLPSVPIAVGADRAAGAARLLEREPLDVFLLDDGFQHWRLQRDVDLVCVDATDPWGGGLLPLGRLRERPRSLARATAVLLTRAELRSDEQLAAIEREIQAHTGAPIVRARFDLAFRRAADGSSMDAAALRDRGVIALSALGHPAGFEANLRAAGLTVAPLRFRDHHAYAAADRDAAQSAARSQNARIVTTEKDWVKLSAFDWDPAADLCVAAIAVRFSPGDERIWRTVLGLPPESA